MNKSGIHIKEENQGALHREMGVAQDKKLTIAALRKKLAAAQKKEEATSSKSAAHKAAARTAKRANFAIVAKTKFHKGK